VALRYLTFANDVGERSLPTTVGRHTYYSTNSEQAMTRSRISDQAGQLPSPHRSSDDKRHVTWISIAPASAPAATGTVLRFALHDHAEPRRGEVAFWLVGCLAFEGFGWRGSTGEACKDPAMSTQPDVAWPYRGCSRGLARTPAQASTKVHSKEPAVA